jgi:acyl-CoA:acyl-CoA alkyltransferase
VPVRVTGVSAYLPDTVMTSTEAEAKLAASGSGHRPRPGSIEKLTGIRRRHVAGDTQYASDLAVAAATELLTRLGVESGTLDLIVFAAASHDILEPATSHVVAAKLGATCPVFDVKNACNSFLNGLQVAEALIATGQYRRVLVCAGETGSRTVRWRITDRAEFVDSFPGYTLSDGGAAMLLEQAPEPGILHRTFGADSTQWNVSVVAGTGAGNLRDPYHDGFIRGDGHRLQEVLLKLNLRGFLDAALDAARVTRDGIAVYCIHQVAVPVLRTSLKALNIPAAKVVMTVADHGNVAACSLPLQLTRALAEGRCGPGDRVALIGLAGGVSVGIIILEL